MTSLTPEQLAEKGLELVPWSSLTDVDLNAWYRWKDPTDGAFWEKIRYVIPTRCCIEIFSDRFNPDQMAAFLEHSTDNGKSWHPCAKVRPIGGRLEHEKILREDLRPNQEAKQ